MQAFSYDAHDKLLLGTSETDAWDLNGNETSVNLGGNLYQMRWDDEDRLVGETNPYGTVDTFTYNGLGLRVGKTDSTGTYSYICDGTTPNSPVLSDGHALYTPGLSENKNGVANYYSFDRLGNLWTLGSSSHNQTYYEDSTAFGSLFALSGNGTPFGFGGGNGSQTDTDIAFVQMGHRFYDSRIGRFISQDPAGDGDNWYAYAGNSPTNAVDPTGLDHIDCDRVPNDWQEQALAMDGDYKGQDVTYDSNGELHWSDGTNDHSYILNDMSGGAEWSASPWISIGMGTSSSGGNSSPGLLDGVGSAFGTGISALGSAATGGLWDGGAAKNQPGFGVSSALATAGMMLIPGGGEARGAETLVTHWDSAEAIANIAENGLKEGSWVMKGKPNLVKWFLTGVWHKYPYGSRITLPVSSVTQEGVDIVQKLLQHYRIGP